MIFASLLVFLVAVEEPEAWEMADDGIRHSMAINEELRLCRLPGDDEDDSVHTDTEEIFGRSAADPILIPSSRPRTLLAMLLALPPPASSVSRLAALTSQIQALPLALPHLKSRMITRSS